MKSKTPLVLVEQIIMILVFAVSAAICLKSFVYSETLSKTVQKQDNAILCASNVAEVIKNSDGKFDAAEAVFGGKTENGTLEVSFSGYENAVDVKAVKTESGIAGLGKAEVRAFVAGEELAFLEVCWQEDILT